MELHIVLHEPEIPQNTGSIGRSCVAMGARLHLIRPLGYSLDDKYLKRAGLDYWQHLDVHHYQNWLEAREAIGSDRNWYGLSTKASSSYWDVEFTAGDVLVFGPETRGLNSEVMKEINTLKIPMRKDAPVRSLNLSSACAITMFEALRQLKTLT